MWTRFKIFGNFDYWDFKVNWKLAKFCPMKQDMKDITDLIDICICNWNDCSEFHPMRQLLLLECIWGTNLIFCNTISVINKKYLQPIVLPFCYAYLSASGENILMKYFHKWHNMNVNFIGQRMRSNVTLMGNRSKKLDCNHSFWIHWTTLQPAILFYPERWRRQWWHLSSHSYDKIFIEMKVEFWICKWS